MDNPTSSFMCRLRGMVWRAASAVLAVVCVQSAAAQYYTVDADTLRLYVRPKAGADVAARVPRGTCLEYKDSTTADGWRMMQDPSDGLVWGWTREQLPEASEEQVREAQQQKSMVDFSIGAMSGVGVAFTILMFFFCVLYLFRYDTLASWFNSLAGRRIVPDKRLNLLLLYPLVVIVPLHVAGMAMPLDLGAILGVGAGAALVAVLIRSTRMGFRAAVWELIYAALSLAAVGYLLTLLVWVLVIYAVAWFVRSDRSDGTGAGSGGGSGGSGGSGDDVQSGNSVDYRRVCGNCRYFRDPMCPREGDLFVDANDDACGSFNQR